jgi:hypothetical protein
MMHMIIRAIVYAKNEKEAVKKARSVFDLLTEQQRPFDDYVSFTAGRDGATARARWGALPAVAKATTPAGAQLINEGWQSTCREFGSALTAVRAAMARYSDAELFEDKIGDDTGLPWFFRQTRATLGASRGKGIFLYDGDGEGITTSAHLHTVLQQADTLDEEDGQTTPTRSHVVWVVPADVHY